MNQSKHIEKHILGQVNSSESIKELEDLGKDWVKRVNDGVRYFVPKLVVTAPKLVERLSVVFQGPGELLNQLDSPAFKAFSEKIANLDPELHKTLEGFELNSRRFASGTLELVTKYLVAQQITKVMEAFLTDSFDGLVKCNGASLYPDLYQISSEPYYSTLQRQRSKTKGKSKEVVETIHGPCVNGSNQPSKVPDGVEIKSKKGKSIRVDCHAAHAGLHLVLTWTTKKSMMVVNDISLAYIRTCDYTECKRNSKATTIKYSFGAQPFISLLKT